MKSCSKFILNVANDIFGDATYQQKIIGEMINSAIVDESDWWKMAAINQGGEF